MGVKACVKNYGHFIGGYEEKSVNKILQNFCLEPHEIRELMT